MTKLQAKNFDSKPDRSQPFDGAGIGGSGAGGAGNVGGPEMRVAELLDRLGRLMRELQYVDGLNPAQWQALRFVGRANKYSRTPGAIARFLCATKGTVSQTISALENKGLVARHPDCRDRRICLIELTAEGEKLLRRDPVKRITKAVDHMDGPTGAALADGLQRLLTALQSDQDAPQFGVCAACCRHIRPGADCNDAGDAADAGNTGDNGRCGITGELLTGADNGRLCVHYSAD